VGEDLAEELEEAADPADSVVGDDVAALAGAAR